MGLLDRIRGQSASTQAAFKKAKVDDVSTRAANAFAEKIRNNDTWAEGKGGKRWVAEIPVSRKQSEILRQFNNGVYDEVASQTLQKLQDKKLPVTVIEPFYLTDVAFQPDKLILKAREFSATRRPQE